MNRTHLTNSESCTIWLPIEFHGFTSRIDLRVITLWFLVLTQFLERVLVPLNMIALLWIPDTRPNRACDQNILKHGPGLQAFFL